MILAFLEPVSQSLQSVMSILNWFWIWGLPKFYFCSKELFVFRYSYKPESSRSWFHTLGEFWRNRNSKGFQSHNFLLSSSYNWELSKLSCLDFLHHWGWVLWIFNKTVKFLLRTIYRQKKQIEFWVFPGVWWSKCKFYLLVQHFGFPKTNSTILQNQQNSTAYCSKWKCFWSSYRMNSSFVIKVLFLFSTNCCFLNSTWRKPTK